MSACLKKIPDFIITDSLILTFIYGMFNWFMPGWIRKGQLTFKNARRILNMKRDLLASEQIEEFETRLAALKTSLTFGFSKKDTLANIDLLTAYVNTVPGCQLQQNTLGENAEAFFVILAIFLGITTFFAKPFRIPTGSMQPSLNGIIIHDYDEEPSILGKGVDFIRYGSSYFEEKAETHKTIVRYESSTKFFVLTYTDIVFDNGTRLPIPCAKGEVMRYIEEHTGSYLPSFSPGETIVRGRIDAGDLIIVNRMVYHFRKPTLGETFVFDTRDNVGIKQRSNYDQGGGTHYVKRLCGLPGDSIQIKQPNLLINGQPPSVWTIQRVVDRKPPYNLQGYMPAKRDPRDPFPLHITENQTLVLAKNNAKPILNEYCALGDNTVSSLDSRYWGTVKQYNIIGPASFALWPFTSHWGLIP